ncbi:kinesin-like protein Klp5, partial [Modicella reniformis]
VFENTTRHLIDGVLNGYNGTLFAYGATGCGKTHTISGTPEKPGINFLTMQELYERIAELEDDNEAIRDLLETPTSNNASLHRYVSERTLPSMLLLQDSQNIIPKGGIAPMIAEKIESDLKRLQLHPLELETSTMLLND